MVKASTVPTDDNFGNKPIRMRRAGRKTKNELQDLGSTSLKRKKKTPGPSERRK